MKKHGFFLALVIALLGQSLFAQPTPKSWQPKLRCDTGQTLISEQKYGSLIDPERATRQRRHFLIKTKRSDIIRLNPKFAEISVHGERLSSFADAEKPISDAQTIESYTQTPEFRSALKRESSDASQIVFTLQLFERDIEVCIEQLSSGCYAGEHCSYSCSGYEVRPGELIYETTLRCINE